MKVNELFKSAAEREDNITLLKLAKEYPIPNEVRPKLYEVCE